MDVQILSESKDELTLELSSVTVAEILRVYLYQEGVEFAAWKKGHYSKPVQLVVRHPNAVKLVKQAVVALQKDTAALAKLK